MRSKMESFSARAFLYFYNSVKNENFRLMTKLAGSLKFNKNARLPFQMMENISIFLENAKTFGVPEQ